MLHRSHNKHKSNYLKQLSNISSSFVPNKSIIHHIEQKLNSPFTGNGTTLLVGKLELKTNKTGFKEYIIPGNVKMSDIMFYDSYIRYIKDIRLC